MAVRPVVGAVRGSLVVSSTLRVVHVSAGQLRLGLHLGLRAGQRAVHADRQRTPDGEQHGEQQQEPKAK